MGTLYAGFAKLGNLRVCHIDVDIVYHHTGPAAFASYAVCAIVTKAPKSACLVESC